MRGLFLGAAMMAVLRRVAGIAETAAAAGVLEQVLDEASARDGISRGSQFALEMIRGSLPAGAN